MFGKMKALWGWKNTPQAGEDTQLRKAYVDNRQLLLFQQVSSPFAAPIVKNMAPIMTIALEQRPISVVGPAVTTQGYGGIVPGQLYLQPLQSDSSGGLS